MASNTRIVEFRRKMKKSKMGVWRKNKLRKFGSTQPDLALNKPNASELKQLKAKQAKKA